MLPSKPKIFHGRESELKDIINILDQESPRIAILGGGGMGKTSLARAVLHHLDTSTKFEHRYFVSAESTTTSIELAALIGLHLGLEGQHDLTRSVVSYFSRKQSCLLVLDNLETPWEPIQSRPGVENLLSLLTDIPHLALIVCPYHVYNFASSYSTDHNARCREARQSSLDPSISPASAAINR
jgi:Cdc6-like AAA superfamily ATPase